MNTTDQAGASRPDAAAVEPREQSIGAIISQARNLSAEQVERVLSYQREHGVRFGEAAVSLGFASADDVLSALAQQFHYPYAQNENKQYSDELVTLTQPFGVQAEAFRKVRSQMLMRLQREGKDRRAVAVVSPDTGDGKSYFCANLAVSLAQLGGRTLLLDADMRAGRLHELFRLDVRDGLAHVMSGRAGTNVLKQVAGVSNLYILPVGTIPPNPVELVERAAFGLLLRELLTKFDHVIVDTPAASLGSDASVIAARCGAAVVLGRKAKTRMDALKDIVGVLDFSEAEVLGVILNEF